MRTAEVLITDRLCASGEALTLMPADDGGIVVVGRRFLDGPEAVGAVLGRQPAAVFVARRRVKPPRTTGRRLRPLARMLAVRGSS